MDHGARESKQCLFHGHRGPQPPLPAALAADLARLRAYVNQLLTPFLPPTVTVRQILPDPAANTANDEPPMVIFTATSSCMDAIEAYFRDVQSYVQGDPSFTVRAPILTDTGGQETSTTLEYAVKKVKTRFEIVELSATEHEEAASCTCAPMRVFKSNLPLRVLRSISSSSHGLTL